MPARRQFGSVRRLPSGRWQARYRADERTTVTAPRTFATKLDAQRWLAGVEADRLRGRWLAPSAGAVTLNDYARRWLDSHARIGRRTREIYEAQLRLHILPTITEGVPALGPAQLKDLTPELVRRWYAALVESKSKSVAAKAYVRLRQILTQAVEDERIAKNPCRIDRGGTERHPEQRFATLEQLYAIADAIQPRYRALVLTAGLAGLRAGELFALRWEDIDLSARTISVRRKRLRLASGEVIEDDPKSRAGLRRVAVPVALVAELDRHRSDFGHAASPGCYVFTTSTGEPIERSNFRYRHWSPATQTVGLEGLRFHDLRHTAGTLAAQTGASTKELMARLGHSSARASLIYQHATADRDRRIADVLDELIHDLKPGDAPGLSGV